MLVLVDSHPVPPHGCSLFHASRFFLFRLSIAKSPWNFRRGVGKTVGSGLIRGCVRGWRRNIENLGELFLHATTRVRLVKCGLCSFQGVFRSALSRNEPPETFSLQTVQEAIKPQVCTLNLACL